MPGSFPNMRRTLLAVLVASLAVACTTDTSVSSENGREPFATSMEIERARAEWEGSPLERYQMEILLICECPPEVRGPFDVVVSGGSATATADGEPVSALAPIEFFTIDGLFAFIDQHANAAELKVRLHADFDVPRLIDVDIDGNTVDDEIQIIVRNFRPDS